MKTIKKNNHQFFTVLGLLLAMGCSDSSSESKKQGPTDVEVPTEEKVENSEEKQSEVETLTSGDQRLLRTGEEYVAAIAKTLNLTKAIVKEATNFAEAKSALPESGAINDSNVSDLSLIKAIEISAKACDYYLTLDEHKDKTEQEIKTSLLDRAVPSQDRADLLSEISERIIKNEAEENKTHTSCASILTFSAIMY